jgi:DNA-binding MarR family transcriptional regulator
MPAAATGDRDRLTDPAAAASELRVVLGRLMRRLRSKNRLPLMHGAVLGRLEREGTSTVSQLAACEGVRPQSMAQTVAELEGAGLVARRPDPLDGRRMLVELTDGGNAALAADRRQREGWLADAIAERLSVEERRVLQRTLALLDRLAEP